MRIARISIAIAACALLFILSGCLSITVDPKLDNPFQITLTGVRELLPLGEQMTVTAAVMDENGCTICPDSYEWYLRGSLLPEKSGTIIIGKELETGSYVLDLVVSKGSVPSSEGAVFEVVE
jgi:hypothetical protein